MEIIFRQNWSLKTTESELSEDENHADQSYDELTIARCLSDAYGNKHNSSRTNI